MSLISAIGNRVISQFGGKTFITETIGNKTLLKVLDSSGRTILERAKSIERTVVGDKKIITRSEARKVYDFAFRSNANESKVYGFKNELNKIYDKKGTLQGIRLKEYVPESKSILSGINPLKYLSNNYLLFKGTVNSFFKNKLDGVIKRFSSKNRVTHSAEMCINAKEATNLGMNKSINEKIDLKIGKSCYTEYAKLFKGERTHNAKGLPMPDRGNKWNEEVLDYDKMENMSLEQMRRYWLEQTGGSTHYGRTNGLSKLDNVTDLVSKDLKDTTKPINDLADFI